MRQPRLVNAPSKPVNRMMLPTISGMLLKVIKELIPSVRKSYIRLGI